MAARSWTTPIAAALLYLSFWATAIAGDWFLDTPFFYMSRPNWSNDLSVSGTRWLPQPESLLTGAALVFLLPAIIVGALYLARRYREDPFERWFRREDAQRTVVVLAVTTAVMMAIVVAFALTRQADILDDERAYLFQARLFAHGKIGLPSPPRALVNPLILLRPIWTAIYPPGNSLVLAPATLVGAEHVVPPVLAGVLVLAVWSAARDMFGPKHGALAALLAGVSPFVWAVHGTVLAFPTSVTALAVFLAALARAERTGKWAWMILAGAAVGLAFITRPYEAAAFAASFAVRMVWEAARRREAATQLRVVGSLVGFAAVAWLLPLHNYLVTGNWLQMPWDTPGFSGFKLGFTHSVFFGELVHTPMQALGNLVGIVQRFDLWALGWPCSVLLVVAGMLRRNPTRGDRLLRWGLGGYLLLYTLVPFPGTWDVGPTYYYALVPLAVPLAVRGIAELRDRARSLDASGVAARFVAWVVLLGIAASVTAIFPMRAIRLTALSTQILEPWQTIEDSNIGPAIVIVPQPGEWRAAGWSWGHPYTLTTAKGDRVDLISPSNAKDLGDAVAYLGNKPVYVLQLDLEHYQKTGHRRYTLEPAPPMQPDANQPSFDTPR